MTSDEAYAASRPAIGPHAAPHLYEAMTLPAIDKSATSREVCGYGADPSTHQDGCSGTRISGYTSCLAHLAEPDQAAYLSGLAPGAELDHRGTPFTETILRGLLQALQNPRTGKPHFGDARFDGATFEGTARLDGAIFRGDVWFTGAAFRGDVRFTGATFEGTAGFGGSTFRDTTDFSGATFHGDGWFDGATFEGAAGFGGARFHGQVWYDGATFRGAAGFGGTTFRGAAGFSGATFHDAAGFSGATFHGDGWFDGATFEGAAGFRATGFHHDACFDGATFRDVTGFDGAAFSRDALYRGVRFTKLSLFGPLVCAQKVDLSNAVFETSMTMEIAARELDCKRTRWESTATLELRYTMLDFSHSVLHSPVAITEHSAPFLSNVTDQPIDERLLAGASRQVRVISIRGVDAAHLVLSGTDLSSCLFSGAFHLDQLRLEGTCSFASAPTGLHRHRIWPYRWTRRRTLAEEHHWRALKTKTPDAPPRRWHRNPDHPDPNCTPKPENIAAIYRQLRKALEDGKNEPGAADFYYGEMEMRRHEETNSPWERGLLRAYWMLSGYGLRASRALGWLLIATTATVLGLMLWGLPAHTPQLSSTGHLNGQNITLTTGNPSLQNPSGPLNRRLTGRRADEALQVTLNTDVFRSPDQALTTAGAYMTMASRLVETILFGLAFLAVRNRVKR